MLGTSKATHGPPLETKPAKAMLGMSKATHGPPLETTKKETTKKETTKKVAKVVIPKPVYPDRSGMSVAERVAALHADAGSVHNQLRAAGTQWSKLKHAVKAVSFMHRRTSSADSESTADLVAKLEDPAPATSVLRMVDAPDDPDAAADSLTQ
jgi:hypothetical protein